MPPMPHRFTLPAIAALVASLALPATCPAQLSDTTLYDFSEDYEGWILQFVERHYAESGQNEVRDYVPFDPEGWDDTTRYPFLPGTDAAANGEGAFQLELHLEGVWDAANAEHRWTDAAYVQSEDWYTHAQSGWPAGYEQHPDYAGGWPYGHYASIGGVAGDYVRLRVYNPGFVHAHEPVEALLFTRSGAGEIYIADGPHALERGWNVLPYPVSAIADPADLRDLGIKLASDHHVWGEMYVDAVTLGSASLDDQRYVYLSPDSAHFSEEDGYDTRTVTVRYDDAGGITPGVRGFHIELSYPAGCVQVTDISPGDFLEGYTNHFEFEFDNGIGEAAFDWVILGATSGASGDGSLATITFAAADGHAGDDCCGPLDLDEDGYRMRDPDNNPLTAILIDGEISHDITPPGDPILSSATHAEGGHTTQTDVQIGWPTTTDGGTCPAGVRGYYLLLDEEPGGVPDPETGSYSWFTPWSPDSTDYVHWFDDLPDGSWYVHIIGYDWLWNATTVDTYGPLHVDTTPPGNISGLHARTTEDADLSVDLSWTNPPSDFAGVKIFRKGFGCYPEYDDDGCAPPDWPGDPADAIANGWTEVYDGTGVAVTDPAPERDYEYYAAFAYDLAGLYAAADPEAQGEALCYWLGDFTVGTDLIVDIYDVLVLSLAYNTEEGDPTYNNLCDIGPTAGYWHQGLPLTDNEIEFEDLIILAIHYENTQWLRVSPTGEPCGGQMRAKLVLDRSGDEIIAQVFLAENPGCLIGASVALSYGPGLEYVGAAEGGLWSGVESFFADAPRDDGVVALDGVALGQTVTGDGCHAAARFRITDPGAPHLGISIEQFRARGPGNVSLAGGVSAQGADAVAPPPQSAIDVPRLLGASPNPTRGGVLIYFVLPGEEQVQLRVFDAAGRLIRQLCAGSHPPGRHCIGWNGMTEGGSPAPPGVYFYRLDAGDVTATRKVMVLN